MFVLYACSDKYTPYLGVSILSLFENNRDIARLEVFVCDDGIQDKNKGKLLDLADKYHRQIHFLDYGLLKAAAIELGWREQGGSFSTYSKILVGKYMPNYVDRVLYIDSSDTLIVGSLRDLETFEMGDHCFAARVAVTFYTKGKSIPSYDFTIAQEKTYYNCGVFLIDMENWKRRKCYEIIAEKSLNDPHFDIFDQTVINTYLPADFGMPLPLKYNYNGYTYAHAAEVRNMSVGGFYSKAEILDASKSPIIIHWPGSTHHPYVRGGLCRKKHLYRSYMKQSPWKDEYIYPLVYSLLKEPTGKSHAKLYKYLPVLQFYCPRISYALYKLYLGLSK